MAYDEKTAERGRGGLLVADGTAHHVAGNEAEAAHQRLLDDVAPSLQHAAHGFIGVQPEGYRTETALKKWIARALAAAASRPKSAAKTTAAQKLVPKTIAKPPAKTLKQK